MTPGIDAIATTVQVASPVLIAMAREGAHVVALDRDAGETIA